MTAALEMWFEKHPGKWPFQCPDDIQYWSQCIEATRKRYNYGNHLKNEIMWYYRNGLIIPPGIVQEFEALIEESLAQDDWLEQESLQP